VDTFFPPADRIVAIGDVHGDVHALRSCLKVFLSCCFQIFCHCSRFVEYFYLKVYYILLRHRSPISRCASLRWNSIICVDIH